jgi:MarR family transcriptional regulator, organic hydroperoxide resistance regulator
VEDPYKNGTIDFFIRQAWFKIQRLYNQQSIKHEISIATGYLLLIIDREGTPSTQIGPRLGMEPTSLSRTLKTMEEEGLIFRKIDKTDKRKVLIFLTEKGIEKRRISKKVVLDLNDKIIEKISLKKIEVYFEVMQKINDLVDVELNKIDD